MTNDTGSGVLATSPSFRKELNCVVTKKATDKQVNAIGVSTISLK